MKNVLLICMAWTGFVFASCDKNEVSPNTQTAITADDLTTARSDAGEPQQPPKLDSVAVKDLSKSITDYIAQNYAGASIEKAGKDKDGNFVVLILQNQKPKGLLFDAKGVFQKELPPPPTKGQQAGIGQGNAPQNPPQLTAVDVAQLPKAITDYLAKNYAGASIDKAGTDKDGNYVILVLQNQKPKGLLFDAKGVFQKELPPPPKKA